MAQTYGNIAAKLPTDRDSEPIQILSPDYANVVNGTSVAGAATATLPVGQDILFLSNTQDIWVAFGGPTDTPSASAGGAGCILFLAGERLIQTPRTLQTSGSTKVFLRVTKASICRASADGNFSIVGMA